MKTTSNKDMLNAIRNQASEEYKERIAVVSEALDVENVYKTIKNYPSIQNEFIDTLTNKVVRTDFFSKVYENPLKMLKKGMLPYGASIEELFVKAADAKGFFATGHDEADALVGKKAAKVKSLYITKNYAHVFEVSISDAQLKAAFMSQNGLSELVNQLVGSLTNGAEQKEYKDMIALIDAAAKGFTIVDKGAGENGLTKEEAIKENTGVVQGIKLHVVKDGTTNPKSIAKAVRSLAGRMKFVSNEYNMAGVETWSAPSDLVFLTTPEIMADLDVNVLATAFNVSATDVNVRTILVDHLPKKFLGKSEQINGRQTGTLNSGVECYGLLMDKDFLQVIDTVNEARQFENGRTLSRNVFLHRQGMLANCYFANCVALVNKDEE